VTGLALAAAATLLAAAADRLDLNHASAAELQTLSGIGPKTAEIIVKTRERNGPFRCVEELRAIPYLSENEFARIRERLTVAEDRCGGLERPAPRLDSKR